MIKRIFNLIISEFLILIESPIIFYPSSKIANKARSIYFKKKLKMDSYPAVISSNFEVRCSNLIEIGDKFMVNKNVTVDACGSSGVYIGNQLMFGPNTYIRAANHSFDNDKPIQEQGLDFKTVIFNKKSFSIVIEDNVWIGANCIILSGAHIGTGSVLNAGSVVSSIIPEGSIVAGNPGRIIKKR
jgi:acetyltransferase-like isoleucine patch superfamily enzyme